MYLMLKDEIVLYFDLDDSVVQVLRPDLVPFCMRGSSCDISTLKYYLSQRVMNFNRANISQICNAFGVLKAKNTSNRIKICLANKGVSITDSYWVKSDDSDLCFDDVNLRFRKFDEISDIALYGNSPNTVYNLPNPELTTKGMFRKSWIRQGDKLYLLKSDNHSQNINTKMEVLASQILSCFANKIRCVEYTGEYVNNLYVDKCENFVGEDYSFVEACEVMNYCRHTGQNFESIFGFSKEASSIAVLDFILSNTDRHTQNYGFLMNNITGELCGLAPLFDFNCALVADAFNRDASDTLSQMFDDKRTIKQVAEYYRPYSKLTLNVDKFQTIRGSNIEFAYIFDRVLERCKQIEII